MLFSTTLTTSILLFVGENDVIAESVHHFHEGIVHDSTILLENSVDVLSSSADFFTQLLLCLPSFEELHLYINFNVILNLLYVVCDTSIARERKTVNTDRIRNYLL